MSKAPLQQERKTPAQVGMQYGEDNLAVGVLRYKSEAV